MTRRPKNVLHHDDPPCEGRLDRFGRCEECGIVPDMQSTCLIHCCPDCNERLKDSQCPKCLKKFVK